jgi:hypothetical protein
MNRDDLVYGAIVRLPLWVADSPESAEAAVRNMLAAYDKTNRGEQVRWAVRRLPDDRQ